MSHYIIIIMYTKPLATASTPVGIITNHHIYSNLYTITHNYPHHPANTPNHPPSAVPEPKC